VRTTPDRPKVVEKRNFHGHHKGPKARRSNRWK
jgi:hypothetical protein